MDGSRDTCLGTMVDPPIPYLTPVSHSAQPLPETQLRVHLATGAFLGCIITPTLFAPRSTQRVWAPGGLGT